MIQSVIFARFLIVHQNETALSIIDDLDSAVADDVFAEGIDAEVHRAGGAGELAEMCVNGGTCFCARAAFQLCHVDHIIVAVEGAAAHLNIGGCQRFRDDFLTVLVIDGAVFDSSLFQLILILIKELLHAEMFVIGNRNFRTVIRVEPVLRCFQFFVFNAAADVEHICTGIGCKIAVIDIGSAAFPLSCIMCPCTCTRTDHYFDNSIPGIRRAAVADVAAAVAGKGAGGSHTDSRTHDCIGDRRVFCCAEQINNLIHERKALVDNAHDAVFIDSLIDNFVLRLCNLGVLVVFCLAFAVSFVFAFLCSLLVAFSDLLVFFRRFFADRLISAAVFAVRLILLCF